MSNTTIALSSLLLMLLCIYAGMHVAITLGVVSFIGVWLIRGDVEIAANLLAQAASDAIASHIFGVVPLFVLTGFLVAYADIGKDAFDVANQLFRRIRGGLGVATVAANAVFAAITGIEAQPVYASAHRWLYALVEQAAGAPCLWNSDMQIGACGDWCIGPRVEAAFESGRAMAEMILSQGQNA